MASQPKKILVFGATGTIGKFITEALVDAGGSFSRLAVFTSVNTIETKAAYIQSLKQRGVEVIAGDINNDNDILAAYEGFDTIVSAVGRNAIDHQIDLIRLAESTTNIKRFFPSEYGTDIEFGPKSPHEKPHQLKLKVRAYLKNEVKRLKYTYLVTGPYADMYIEKSRGDPKAGSFDVRAKKAVLLGSGDEKIALTTMAE
jgi:NmrA-like family protein